MKVFARVSGALTAKYSFNPMATATIAIPTRWEEATFQIEQFIKDYAQKSGVAFDVSLTGQLDTEQIYIFEDSLGPMERVVCQNAVSELSDYLNHRLSHDPWQARTDVMKQLEADIEKIGDLVEHGLREH
jgi:hypothetical protein